MLVDLKSSYRRFRWRVVCCQNNGSVLMECCITCTENNDEDSLQVLAQEERIRKGYIDSLTANDDVVSTYRVVKHLERYGMETKALEKLDGVWSLDLPCVGTGMANSSLVDETRCGTRKQ